MTNGSVMKVESIAECSPWSILQYFRPALSDNWSWKPIYGILRVSVLHRSRSLAWSILQYFRPALSDNWSWYQFMVFLRVAVLHRSRSIASLDISAFLFKEWVLLICGKYHNLTYNVKINITLHQNGWHLNCHLAWCKLWTALKPRFCLIALIRRITTTITGRTVYHLPVLKVI